VTPNSDVPVEPIPDFECLDTTVAHPSAFLHEDLWRVLRIQSDAIQSIEMMPRWLCQIERVKAFLALIEQSPGPRSAGARHPPVTSRRWA
jgi:hypothetical protein